MALNFSFLLFNQLDWAIIAIVIVLLLWYTMRGVFKVLISLLIWLMALLIAQLGSLLLEEFLASYIKDTELLQLLPFALIFIFTFIFLNLLTSFFNFGGGIVTGPAARLLAAFFSIPLITVQLLVLLQFAYLLAVHRADYWYSSQLVPYVLDLEKYWDDWVIFPLCQTSSLCVG